MEALPISFTVLRGYFHNIVFLGLKKVTQDWWRNAHFNYKKGAGQNQKKVDALRGLNL